MVNVIARSRLKSGCMEEYLRILKANVPTVLAEEGCLRYEPCLDLDADPARGEYVTILESWESQASAGAPRDETYGRISRGGGAAPRGEQRSGRNSGLRGNRFFENVPV